MERSNHSVYMTQSITKLKIRVLEGALGELSPKRRIFVITAPLSSTQLFAISTNVLFVIISELKWRDQIIQYI